MENRIFTSANLWNDINIASDGKEEPVLDVSADGLRLIRFYFDGRKTEEGNTVKIFASMLTPEKKEAKNALLVVGNMRDPVKENFLKHLSKDLGIAVMGIDAYSSALTTYKTEYPDEISYARFSEAEKSLYAVPEDCRKTCWYEWVISTLYAVDFLFKKGFEQVGVLGTDAGANLLWKTVAIDKRLTCACMINGVGWETYKGKFKYGEDNEPEFTDNVYRYVSCFDAQTYAKQVKVPVMTVNETNNPDFDADRAVDTLIRTPSDDACAYYVIGSDCYLDEKAFDNVERYIKLRFDGKEIKKSDMPEIRTQAGKDGITVVAEDGEKTRVFASQGRINPSSRYWEELSGSDGKFVYKKQGDSKYAFFIAEKETEKGLLISSGITAVRFDENEKGAEESERIIYDSDSEFVPFIPELKKEKLAYATLLDEEDKVVKKKGPFKLYGITSENGLKTYKVGSGRNKPGDGMSLMADVYAENGATLTVGYAENVNTPKERRYSYTIKLQPSKVWVNVIIDAKRCFDKDHLPLTSYKNVEALIITYDEECLFNNILWI